MDFVQLLSPQIRETITLEKSRGTKPHTVWEATQVVMINVSQEYSRERAQECKMILSQLETYIEKLEKN